MKLKKFGKNKRELKKILSHESTKVTQGGKDVKQIIEKLLGYDYQFKMINGILQLTDVLGDKWEITTDLEVEVVA